MAITYCNTISKRYKQKEEGKEAKRKEYPGESIRGILITGKFLLELRDVHEGTLVHDAGQLAHESHVLRHVASHLSELGVALHEPLHLIYILS